MAKKQDSRHGDPVEIDFSADKRFSPRMLEHIQSLVDAGAAAKARGHREIYDNIMAELDACCAITNTTSRLQVHGMQAMPWGTTTINDGVPSVGVSPKVTLKENQQAIVDVIRSYGRRLNTDELLAALQERGLPSSSAAKQQFAFLVQVDALDNKTDAKGAGYGLPEWSGKS